MEINTEPEYPLQLVHVPSEGSATESFIPPKVAAADEINLVKIEGK